MKILITIFSILLIALKSLSQSIKTKPYWQQLKTDEYKGKQDDIYFLNENLGWYCNGSGKFIKQIMAGKNGNYCSKKREHFSDALHLPTA